MMLLPFVIAGLVIFVQKLDTIYCLTAVTIDKGLIDAAAGPFEDFLDLDFVLPKLLLEYATSKSLRFALLRTLVKLSFDPSIYHV